MADAPDTPENDNRSRLSSLFAARADESALWTLVNGVGQFVLSGWCLTFASLALLIGFSQLVSDGGLPAWLNGVLAAFLIGLGAVLLFIGLRFLAQSFSCFWVAWRKAWFMFRYYRSPDARRAFQAAEGDPVLGPYVRHLLKRGLLHLGDEV